tara:strand:- start:7443 stop:8066 length:624 start_codon:yes stop_codon:yes gene_type:complete
MISKKKIGIIDYGAGNLASICNAINYLEFEVKVISNTNEIKDFSHLILPGVGSFGKLANNLNENDWPEKLKDFREKGKYIFGICVGMQLLFEKSEETKNAKGLGFIKGSFEMFNSKNNLPIPHMGFNEVSHNKTAIWNGIKNHSPFYFVHSYRVASIQDKSLTSKTTYGEEFISFIENDNVFGSQFHPEKSHNSGLKLLKNFIELKN